MLSRLILASSAISSPVCGHHQGVDLDQAGITLDKQVVQALHEILKRPDLTTLEIQAKGQFAALVTLQSGRRIDGNRHDLLGGFGSHLFDIHAAGAGSHEQDAPGLPVHQHTQIEFTGDIGRLFHQHDVDRQSGFSGLLGDQHAAEQASRLFLYPVQAVNQYNAAGFAASTGVDLGFNHPAFTLKRLGGCARLCHCRCWLTL